MSKLVRDLIPEIIPKEKRSGLKFTTVDDDTFESLLKDKLIEEVNEFLEAERLGKSSNDILEELADIYEVLESIMKVKKFAFEELNRVKEQKKKERGGFEKQILMEAIHEMNICTSNINKRSI